MALSKDERIKKVDELKKFWIDLFTVKDLGVKVESDVYFYPKPLFMRNKCFNLFETELKGLFFTEIVDFNYNPTNPRKLFKIQFNEDCILKYKKIGTPIGDQYEVPFIEFTEIINEVEEEIITKVPLEDQNYSDLTARDYACIHLKVAKSNKKWLNELIKESR